MITAECLQKQRESGCRERQNANSANEMNVREKGGSEQRKLAQVAADQSNMTISHRKFPSKPGTRPILPFSRQEKKLLVPISAHDTLADEFPRTIRLMRTRFSRRREEKNEKTRRTSRKVTKTQQHSLQRLSAVWRQDLQSQKAARESYFRRGHNRALT